MSAHSPPIPGPNTPLQKYPYLQLSPQPMREANSETKVPPKTKKKVMVVAPTAVQPLKRGPAPGQ